MVRETRTVGLVHLHCDRHGVSIFGDDSAAIIGMAGWRSITPISERSIRDYLGAFRRLWNCDVVHVQWTKRYWGRGLAQAVLMLLMMVLSYRRPLVVTLHDVHHEATTEAVPAEASGAVFSSPLRRVRVRPGPLLEQRLMRRATAVIVFSPEEAAVVADASRKVSVVEHHILDRPRVRVNSSGTTQFVVLGYVHRRKGQLLAVEALPHFPGATLVLCGSAESSNESYLKEVLSTASRLGVADRVVYTGFVDNETMAGILASSSIALCPYERIAASGSISTLVGARLPIVARETAYTRRLRDRAVAGVELFGEWDVPSLVEATRRALALSADDAARGMGRLIDHFGAQNTASKLGFVYQEALSGFASPRGCNPVGRCRRIVELLRTGWLRSGKDGPSACESTAGVSE